jgi:UDP-N-acetylmuramyl pentapeptide phosphotransferase/UDP-N-acetylglucosamine-1-phosphate transferase
MRDLVATSLLVIALVFAVSFALLRLLLLPAAQRWFLDQPNQRSLHASPVPRTGGLGVVPSLAASVLLTGGDGLLIALAIALMLLSLVDDWKNLPASWRLLGHVAAAAAFVLVRFPAAGWIEVTLLVLAVAWMINLYNFMDGADGLAGGMTVIGFAAYAAAAGFAGNAPVAVTSLCVVAAVAAFLVFNFPPARIFMGDSGSIPLGFLAAAVGLLGWRDELWPLWFPLVVFAPFVIDASVTLARRALRGERVWQAHRSHYYQRLVLSGWSHRQLAVAEYGLMLLTSGASLLVLHRPVVVQLLILAALGVIYVLVGRTVDLRWQASQRGASNSP